MGVYQGNDFRKISGGKKRPHRGKRRYEIGNYPAYTMLGDEERVELERVRGGNIKVRLKQCLYVNVVSKGNITKRVKILRVIATPANREYVKRNIITKGAVIETELGRARVTSRPGQDGVVNAILIS